MAKRSASNRSGPPRSSSRGGKKSFGSTPGAKGKSSSRKSYGESAGEKSFGTRGKSRPTSNRKFDSGKNKRDESFGEKKSSFRNGKGFSSTRDERPSFKKESGAERPSNAPRREGPYKKFDASSDDRKKPFKSFSERKSGGDKRDESFGEKKSSYRKGKDFSSTRDERPSFKKGSGTGRPSSAITHIKKLMIVPATVKKPRRVLRKGNPAEIKEMSLSVRKNLRIEREKIFPQHEMNGLLSKKNLIRNDLPTL
jgi:hypothetical protein